MITASVKFSFKLNIGCPKDYKPKKFVLDWVKKNKGKINIYNDAKKAVKNADVIFVLEKGKIIEEGDYKTLIENKNFFYDLVKKQLH